MYTLGNKPLQQITKTMTPLAKGITGAVCLLGLAGIAVAIGAALASPSRNKPSHPPQHPVRPMEVVQQQTDLLPVRDEPEHFPRNSHMPDEREGNVSGSVNPELFSPGRDLIYFADDRIWWESDNDAASGDDECDHSMHIALRDPLRRLVEMVSARGGVLEVQDAYRPAQVHSSRSLHKEGRALDLTCDQLGLEALAKLCWAAGFDWVYYETGSGGEHIHVSVRRDHAAPPETTTHGTPQE